MATHQCVSFSYLYYNQQILWSCEGEPQHHNHDQEGEGDYNFRCNLTETLLWVTLLMLLISIYSMCVTCVACI